MQERIRSSNMGYDMPFSKQKFQSQDSEGSDVSYQSSLSDDNDHIDGRIDFFKEQMARFFINYPELINKDILQDPSSQKSIPKQAKESDKLNKHWQQIANQILNEAKQSSTSLQSLAKRISLYRYKIQQSDIVDLLIKNKEILLKQIESQIAQKKMENNNFGQNNKNSKHTQNKLNQQHTYFSWRKKKQLQFKSNALKNTETRSSSLCEKQNQQVKNNSIHKFNRSLHKTQTPEKNKNNLVKKDLQKSLAQSRKIRKDVKQEDQNRGMQQSFVVKNKNQKQQANWRHLSHFQPKSQIGKQLCEQIKKNHTPNDELGIKKTIIQFLIRYKQLLNNEVINKTTLSQKIQKLYNDDAKQLLMFYPSKINTYENPNLHSLNFKDPSLEDQFTKMLTQITNGPLMTYWRQMQQSKI